MWFSPPQTRACRPYACMLLRRGAGSAAAAAAAVGVGGYAGRWRRYTRSGAGSEAVSSENAAGAPGAAAAAAPRGTAAGGRREVEKIYKTLSPRDHVLQRPDMYVGSVKSRKEMRWVAALQKPLRGLGGTRKGRTWVHAHREVEVVPALLKIVDELLVNVSDNYHRTRGTPRATTALSVTLSPTDGVIKIRNNGAVIDVAWHPDSDCYCPELVFGRFQSGSNFDDDELRITGGRNGIGAKAANVLSKYFRVTICDALYGRSYVQEWRDSMRECGEPAVEDTSIAEVASALPEVESATTSAAATTAAPVPAASTAEEEFTEIEFLPDYAYFGLRKLDADHFAVLCARVGDLAACCPDLEVTLNGVRVPWSGFAEHVRAKQAALDPAASTLVHTSVTDDVHSLPWRIAVTPKLPCGDVSYANGVATANGGPHLSAVERVVIDCIQTALFRKHRWEVPDRDVRAFVTLFVDATVANPEFCGQTKDRLTHPKVEWVANSVRVPKAFLADVVQSAAIMAPLEEYVANKMKRTKKLKRVQRLKQAVPKLYDARLAGSARALDCSLILTEGDSAKSLALSGLSALGRDLWGVYPLRGKLDNPRKRTASSGGAGGGSGSGDATSMKMLQEVQSVLGLVQGCAYTTPDELATLRYGSVTLMCDQDHDGHHIRGLVINWLAYHWPNLVCNGVPATPAVAARSCENTSTPFETTAAIESATNPERTTYIRSIHTPLVKAMPKRGGGAEAWMYSAAAVKAWTDARERDGTLARYKLRYYKGLGSSTSAEGREYFRLLAAGAPEILVRYDGAREADEAAIELAFGSGVSERRMWLEGLAERGGSDGGALPPPDTDADAAADPAAAYARASTLENFVQTDLAEFFVVSNMRAIPSCIDGLKPAQRKIIYTCLKRRLHAPSEMKVVQLAGATAELTAYRHGENALHLAIVKLAQDYVGCGNNVPLLEGLGQFGSRLAGGTDYASPRYISTRLSPLARLLFREEDDALLEHAVDDGITTEPEIFYPVLPTLLLNGTAGIGTGYNTVVRPCDPLAVAALVYTLATSPAKFEWASARATARAALRCAADDLADEQERQMMTDVEKAWTRSSMAVEEGTGRAEKGKGKAGKRVGVSRRTAELNAARRVFVRKEKEKWRTRPKALRLAKLAESAKQKFHEACRGMERGIKKRFGGSALLLPWYQGHRHPLCEVGASGVPVSRGSWTTPSEHPRDIIVDELPVGIPTDDFQARMEALVEAKVLAGCENASTDTAVLFKLTRPKRAPAPGGEKKRSGAAKASKTPERVLDAALRRGLQENVTGITADGRVVKLVDAFDAVVLHYFPARRAMYEKRVAAVEVRIKRLLREEQDKLKVLAWLQAHPRALAGTRSALEAGVAEAGLPWGVPRIMNLRASEISRDAFDRQGDVVADLAVRVDAAAATRPEDVWCREITDFVVAYVEHTAVSVDEVNKRLKNAPAELVEAVLARMADGDAGGESVSKEDAEERTVTAAAA